MRVLIAGTDKDTPNYQAALTAMGIPFDVKLTDIDFEIYDRLVLPGGGDIDPSYFGQENDGSNRIDKELDEQQFSIFRKFFDAGKPVLGICRGCQIINVALGGDMIQDLPTAEIHKGIPDGGEDFYHKAAAEPGSVLYELYGAEFIINSHHHQGCGKMGSGLRCTMKAPDGAVEAIEHEDRPVIGVQWHPERTGFAFLRDDVVDGEKVWRYFINM